MSERSEALPRIRRLAELDRRSERGTITPAEEREYSALIGSREPWASSPGMVAWLAGASYTEIRRMPAEWWESARWWE